MGFTRAVFQEGFCDTTSTFPTYNFSLCNHAIVFLTFLVNTGFHAYGWSVSVLVFHGEYTRVFCARYQVCICLMVLDLLVVG